MAFVGDTGVSEDTLAVYRLIKGNTVIPHLGHTLDEKAELMVHLGDFDVSYS